MDNYLGKTYTFESVAFSSKFLNVFGVANEGANVGLQYVDGSLAQQWKVVETSAYNYKLQTMKNTSCFLDRYVGSGSNYNNADIWEATAIGAGDQEILITHSLGNVVYISMSVYNNNTYVTTYYLTAVSNDDGTEGGKTNTSAGNVYWAEALGENGGLTSAQKWRMTEVVDGTHTISNGLDTIAPLTEGTLNAINYSSDNVEFIARYYCSDTTKTKLLKSDEASLISDKGFAIVSVYQDRNNRDSDFSDLWYESDANGAYQAAVNAGQPAGTAIYFAVDYNPDESSINEYIIPYFQAIKNKLENKAIKYKIGVYGSGLVCRTIKQKLGLAEYSWLAMSTGYWGSEAYDDPRLYDIKQFNEHPTYNGVKFDRDISGYNTDFGQWSL